MCGEEQVGNVEQDIQLLMISIYVVIVLKRVSILKRSFRTGSVPIPAQTTA